jgi:uncharacterized damage-inducible protein DinB
MDNKDHIINEFKLRVFEESFTRIEKCFSMLEEDEIWKSPNESIAPIGCLVLHLVGNAKQWVCSGLGNTPDDRNRDWEFEIHSELSKATVFQSLTNIVDEITDVLDNALEEDLERMTVVQDFKVSGFSILVHVIEHFSYHTGQISLLTKLLKNKDLGYYDDHEL